MILRTDLPALSQTENTLSISGAVGTLAPEEELSVGAAEPRTVTNVVLDESQQVVITYISGKWRPGLTADWPPVGPEGDNRVPGKASFPLPSAPLMALIFGVEGSDQVFAFEGNPTVFIAPASGVLWFGPNDDGFDDNAGELVINVILE
jgi:hypothetical protein